MAVTNRKARLGDRGVFRTRPKAGGRGGVGRQGRRQVPKMVAAKPGATTFVRLVAVSGAVVLASSETARACTPEWGYQPTTPCIQLYPANPIACLTHLPGLCVCMCIEKSCECPPCECFVVPVSIPLSSKVLQRPALDGVLSAQTIFQFGALMCM